MAHWHGDCMGMECHLTEREKAMRIEFQEWAREVGGERDDMGVHLYSLEQALRVIRRGGALETAINFITTESGVITQYGAA